MTPTTAAVAKAAGGAGATRTSLELAATLARAGESVAVLDVDLATQGLARRVPGRIDPDATRVYLDEAPLADALVELELDVDGSVSVCPARAPFERVARAKTPEAAQRFEAALARADELFDRVLVDTPVVATNPSVAAVTAADRVAAVAPASERGADALAALRERLQDVGASPGLSIATRADGSHPVEADEALPSHDASPSEVPTCTSPEETYAPAVAAAAEALFGCDLELSFDGDGLLAGRLG